ncbi:RNase LS family HEPN domain-containing protein [Comamonas thiooxydans]|uniref:RNase LS family HEPN domain-containing protein n=1 Tax=Comamonas thiooxydans TaxID=363952 RepID=UPI002115069E|nr:RNase LS family HEPN domain-containing protein [Comamonas thiooxydans]UUE95360.1 RNase LS family HEPN domain-containing protein [Comamonas thiooxydans]
MSGQQFKGISIDPERIEPSLRALGVADLVIQPKSQTHRVLLGTFDGERFSINLYLNNNGRCTLGRVASFSEAAFGKVAQHIASTCSYGSTARLELSVGIPKDQPQTIIEFLQSQGASVEAPVTQPVFTQWRVRGPRGDALVLKAYANGTFQAQGPHAQVASWLFDYLGNVLQLDAVLEAQREIYRIPLSTQAVQTELKARIPAVHDYLEEKIRKQFSTAHALTKVGIELEDYSTIAFPALRGIEGFCFQVLRQECHFKPTAQTKLGSYFKSPYHGAFTLDDPYREGLGQELITLLDNSYTMWNKQRHALFHMDAEVELSRTIESLQAAVDITTEVLTTVDRDYGKYAQYRT